MKLTRRLRWRACLGFSSSLLVTLIAMLLASMSLFVTTFRHGASGTKHLSIYVDLEAIKRTILMQLNCRNTLQLTGSEVLPLSCANYARSQFDSGLLSLRTASTTLHPTGLNIAPSNKIGAWTLKVGCIANELVIGASLDHDDPFVNKPVEISDVFHGTSDFCREYFEAFPQPLKLVNQISIPWNGPVAQKISLYHPPAPAAGGYRRCRGILSPSSQSICDDFAQFDTWQMVYQAQGRMLHVIFTSGLQSLVSAREAQVYAIVTKNSGIQTYFIANIFGSDTGGSQASHFTIATTPGEQVKFEMVFANHVRDPSNPDCSTNCDVFLLGEQQISIFDYL